MKTDFSWPAKLVIGRVFISRDEFSQSRGDTLQRSRDRLATTISDFLVLYFHEEAAIISRKHQTVFFLASQNLPLFVDVPVHILLYWLSARDRRTN